MASHIVEYPGMGPNRELKLAQESFWDGKSSAGDLQKLAADLSNTFSWKQMADTGIEYISSNTFSCYDQAAALKGSDHRRATNVSARLDAQQKKFNLHLLPTSTIVSFPHTMELRKVHREYIAKKVSDDDYVKAIEEIKKEMFSANAAAQAPRKSSPRGQRCGGPKLFVIEETKGDRDLIAYTEDDLWHCLPEELKEYFGKSPPAISRSPIPKTMRVKIMVNSHEYIALIDTGSTYNVLHPRVAREMELQINKDDRIKVSVADGFVMHSEGSCPEFKFVIQGGQFSTPAHILQLGEFDVILGIQWLMGLGDIKNWNFASLKMELTQGGKTIQIKGMDTEESEAGCSTDEKLLSMVREGVKYGAGIVYDIHSPRVPSTEEIADGINKMLAVLKTIQVNPDCGLKTRKCTEVKPALKNKLLRSQLVSAK